LPSGEGGCNLYCAVIVKQVDARTRSKTSINELLGAYRGRRQIRRSPRIDRSQFQMSVHLKTPEEIEKMRVAGRLAAEVLDFVAPHVRPNITTDEPDALFSDYMGS